MKKYLGVVSVLVWSFFSSSLFAGEVMRSQFTTGIDAREPVDQVEQLSVSAGKVYFFTELLDLSDEYVTHRWKYNGEVMAEIGFNVGGNRWRVWSSKNVAPEWTGTWQVDVVDVNETVIDSKQIVFVE